LVSVGALSRCCRASLRDNYNLQCWKYCWAPS